MKKLKIIGNRAEDIEKAKKLFQHFYKKNHGDLKKTQKDIVKNVVNNTYVRQSNEVIDLIWNEFNKYFPS